jgi:DNA repair exonuclease SbcCD ATPase subunit
MAAGSLRADQLQDPRTDEIRRDIEFYKNLMAHIESLEAKLKAANLMNDCYALIVEHYEAEIERLKSVGVN